MSFIVCALNNTTVGILKRTFGSNAGLPFDSMMHEIKCVVRMFDDTGANVFVINFREMYLFRIVKTDTWQVLGLANIKVEDMEKIFNDDSSRSVEDFLKELIQLNSTVVAPAPAPVVAASGNDESNPPSAPKAAPVPAPAPAQKRNNGNSRPPKNSVAVATPLNWADECEPTTSAPRADPKAAPSDLGSMFRTALATAPRNTASPAPVSRDAKPKNGSVAAKGRIAADSKSANTASDDYSW